MRYSLPATTACATASSTSFTRKELANIQRSSNQVLLSAMGFNRNMPLEVVFGPASLGSVSLRQSGGDVRPSVLSLNQGADSSANGLPCVNTRQVIQQGARIGRQVHPFCHRRSSSTKGLGARIVNLWVTRRETSYTSQLVTSLSGDMAPPSSVLLTNAQRWQ
jgi:hypothetical protein